MKPPANETASLLFAIDPHFTLPLEREDHQPATIADLKSGAQLFVWPVNANGDTVCVFSVESECQADDFECEPMPIAAIFNAAVGMMVLVWAFSPPVPASAVAASAESLGVVCGGQQIAPICPFDSKFCTGLDFRVGIDVGVGLFGHSRIPMPSPNWKHVYLDAAQTFALDDLPRIYGNSAYGARTHSLDELARVDGVVGA